MYYHLYEALGVVNSNRQKAEWWFPGLGDWENRELLCNGCKVSIWEDKKDPEMNGGDSRTTI